MHDKTSGEKVMRKKYAWFKRENNYTSIKVLRAPVVGCSWIMQWLVPHTLFSRYRTILQCRSETRDECAVVGICYLHYYVIIIKFIILLFHSTVRHKQCRSLLIVIAHCFQFFSLCCLSVFSQPIQIPSVVMFLFPKLLSFSLLYFSTITKDWLFPSHFRLMCVVVRYKPRVASTFNQFCSGSLKN